MTTFGKTCIGGVALAAAGVLALAACTGSSATPTSTAPGAVAQPGSIGVIPAAGPASGNAASIRYALPPGAVPNWILPMPTASTNVAYNVFTFEWEMWRPLYYTPDGATPAIDSALSLATSLPVMSNDGKTMTITLKPWKWSNGETVSSRDLEFTFDEIAAAVKESPANWAADMPGRFPATIVSMSTPNASTLVVNLKSPVNPTWIAENIIDISVMPSAAWAKDSANGPILDFTNPANATKIFNYLTAQSESADTYATNPLWQTVDGPYKLSSFNDTTGAFTMVPNTSYGGPHANPMSDFVGVPFTSNAAEWNAIVTGAVDFGYVPQADVPQLARLKGVGYNYYGLPDFGNYFVAYNFMDKTGSFNAIASQLYFRQAMQHLEDQAGQIKDYFDGAGDPAYGPIPAYPTSPFQPANAATNPFPFSVTSAMNILKANGWTVTPDGTDACAHPGTGPGECGAGVPAGAKLAFNLVYDTTPPIPQQVEDLASNAKAAGIEITLQGSNHNYMIQNYNDAAAPANANEWAMEDIGGETNSTYPTQFGVYNTGGSGQIGAYSNPTADDLINDSISSANPSAVTNEASFFTTNLPVLWQPVIDDIWAWKTNISATDPTGIENLTQYTATPELWYLTK